MLTKSQIRGEAGAQLNYDELVVYDNDAIRPSYLALYDASYRGPFSSVAVDSDFSGWIRTNGRKSERGDIFCFTCGSGVYQAERKSSLGYAYQRRAKNVHTVSPARSDRIM